MEDYIKTEASKELVKASIYRPAGRVCQITADNNDGTFDVTTSDGQTYGSVTPSSSQAYTTGAWVTVEFANSMYQIAGYSPYQAGEIGSLTASSSSGTSSNGGSSNTFSG